MKIWKLILYQSIDETRHALKKIKIQFDYINSYISNEQQFARPNEAIETFAEGNGELVITPALNLNI